MLDLRNRKAFWRNEARDAIRALWLSTVAGVGLSLGFILVMRVADLTARWGW